MSLRVFALLPLLLTLSCSSPAPKAPTNEGPQAASWSGTWTRLEGLAVPQEKKRVLAQSCTQTPEYWTIEQNGDVIAVEYHEATTASGVMWSVESRRIERVQGERRKSFVHLDGHEGIEEVRRGREEKPPPGVRPARFPVTYELEWDPQTDHLAGTRNGKPVRFVRADLTPVDRSQCQPVPQSAR